MLEVEETGSGAANDRPGLQRIRDAARGGKIDVVLVWKLDRFGRSALGVSGASGTSETDHAGSRTPGLVLPCKRHRCCTQECGDTELGPFAERFQAKIEWERELLTGGDPDE